MLKQITCVVENLATVIGCRPLGSEANLRAMDYIETEFAKGGHEVERQSFTAKGWEPQRWGLEINGYALPMLVSPYSPSFEVKGSALRIDTLEKLAALGPETLRGRILLLEGEIASETVMPKYFEFYNPEHHQRLVSLLEEAQPSLVLAVRDQDLPDSVTGVSGKTALESLFNDGDIAFSSATVTKRDLTSVEAERLEIAAFSEAKVPVRQAGNLIVRIGDPALPRILVTAHLDTTFNTPGALDDASGIAFLAALAQSGLSVEGYCIELVAINGEDHYSYGGEKELMRYLGSCESMVKLAVNVDGLGFRDTESGVSLYAMPEELGARLEASVRLTKSMAMMEPWPQGDHMIFAMMGIPTIALASYPFEGYLAGYHHSPLDTPELLDPMLVMKAVLWLKHFLETESL